MGTKVANAGDLVEIFSQIISSEYGVPTKVSYTNSNKYFLKTFGHKSPHQNIFNNTCNFLTPYFKPIVDVPLNSAAGASRPDSVCDANIGVHNC